MPHTKESIVNLLRTNDRAVGRALVALYERQTYAERNSERTIEFNGVGFTGVDGGVGASMAKAFMKYDSLTPKQVAYWRKTNKNGVMRIGKYWRQLLEIASEKEKKKQLHLGQM